MSNRKKWTNDEIEFLKSNYHKINGPKICFNSINRTINTIYEKAFELNLQVDDKVNAKCFTDVNKLTKESAYILGIIYADGSIRVNKKNLYAISISLLKDDMDKILPAFKTIGEWNVYSYKVKEYREVLRVLTHNKELYNFLFEYDYYEKSYSTPDKILSYIPDNLKGTFIRDYFDSDGHIGLIKKINTYVPKFNFCSYYVQDWSFMVKIMDQLNVKSSIYRVHSYSGSRSVIHIHRIKDILKFCDYMFNEYEKDKIGIQRKYDKYIKLKTAYENKLAKQNVTI